MRLNLRGRFYQLFDTGFFHIFGSSVINKIVTFLSSVILVRLLSQSEYGVYSYALNIYSLLLIFSGFGIGSAAMQVCSERGSDGCRGAAVYFFCVGYGTKVNCILACVMVLVGLFVTLPIAGAGRILLMLAFLPIISIWFELQQVYLRVKRENKHYSLMTTVNTLLVSAGTIVGAATGGIEGVAVSRYFAAGISVLAAYCICRVPLFQKKADRLDKGRKRDVLKIATISMANNGLSQLLYLLDVFVIGLVMVDEKAVAIYKVATQIPTALTFVPSCVVTYIYPYFAYHCDDPDWCMKKYKRLLSVMGAGNGIISAALFLFAPAAIKIIYGIEYLDAVPAFRILSVSYFFSGTFRTIAGNLLVTQRKLKYNLFVGVVSGTVNIVADFCLISFMGEIGAALATFLVVLITSVMTTSYYIYTLKKKERG